MSKKKKDILISALFIIFGIGMAVYSTRYRNSSTFETDVGSNFVPMLCSLGIAILSAIHMIDAFLDRDPAYSAEPEKTTAARSDLLRGAATIGLLLAYVACFRKIGFLVSSIVYLFLQLMVFSPRDKRRWILNAVLAVVLPTVIYVLFVHVMNYMLPPGILG